MVREPKITIKFFLHEGLKPSEEGGFPVYAKISFLRRNTQLPMLDYKGEEIYSEPKLFKRFEEDFERFGPYANQQWWDEVWIDVLSKGLLLRKTIERFYQKEGKGIDMKEVIPVFRIFERNVWVLLREHAVTILSSLIKPKDLVHPSALVYKTELSKPEREMLELFTAYAGFMSFSWEKIRKESFQSKRGLIVHPTVFGTIFSWRYEGEKQNFIDYLQSTSYQDIKKHAQLGGGLFKEFVEMFFPDLEDVESYVSLVDRIISNNVS